MTHEEFLKLDVGDIIYTNSRSENKYKILDRNDLNKPLVIKVDLTNGTEIDISFPWRPSLTDSYLDQINVIWGPRYVSILDSLKDQVQNKFKILKNDTIEENTSNS